MSSLLNGLRQTSFVNRTFKPRCQSREMIYVAQSHCQQRALLKLVHFSLYFIVFFSVRICWFYRLRTIVAFFFLVDLVTVFPLITYRGYSPMIWTLRAQPVSLLFIITFVLSVWLGWSLSTAVRILWIVSRSVGICRTVNADFSHVISEVSRSWIQNTTSSLNVTALKNNICGFLLFLLPA